MLVVIEKKLRTKDPTSVGQRIERHIAESMATAKEMVSYFKQ